jgi:FkbM family methyltransferase
MNINEITKISCGVYEKLEDQESKEIYINRLLYTMTNDIQYIREIIKMSLCGKNFLKHLNEPGEKFIFGAGIWGKHISDIWSGYWSGFLDNNTDLWGKHINGLEVYSSNMFLNKSVESNSLVKVFIGTRLYYNEIKKQLIEMGVAYENIINVGEILDSMIQYQYFDLQELTHVDNEVFVDMGCFDGKSALSFVDWSRNNYKHIYSFEPDKKNFFKCKKALSTLIKDEKLTLINKGAWSCNTKLFFDATGKSASAISDQGDEILVTALDDELKDKQVSFIKMDIEGAELEALRGAKSLIIKQKPKLAISIYHKTEDILELPQLILSYRGDYKLYLRHYTLGAFDTILYAI